MSSIGKNEDDPLELQFKTFNNSNDDNNSIISNTDSKLGKFNSIEVKCHFSQTHNEKYNTGIWSKDERRKYFEGIIKYPNSWKDIQRHIKTRNSYQVRSFSQKVFFKLKTKHKESKDEYNNIFLEERDLINEFESLCNESSLSEDYYALYMANKSVIIDRLKYLNKQNFKVENRIANIKHNQSDGDQGSCDRRISKKQTNNILYFKARFKTKKVENPKNITDIKQYNFQYNEVGKVKVHDFGKFDQPEIPYLTNLYHVPRTVTTIQEKSDYDDCIDCELKIKNDIKTFGVQSNSTNSTAFKTNDGITINLTTLDSLSYKNSLVTGKETDISPELLDPNKAIKTIINNNKEFPSFTCYDSLKKYFLKSYSRKHIKKTKEKSKKLKGPRILYDFHDEIQFDSVMFLSDINSKSKESKERVIQTNTNNEINNDVKEDNKDSKIIQLNFPKLNENSQVNQFSQFNDVLSNYSYEYPNADNYYSQKNEYQSNMKYCRINDIIMKDIAFYPNSSSNSSKNSVINDESIFNKNIGNKQKSNPLTYNTFSNNDNIGNMYCTLIKPYDKDRIYNKDEKEEANNSIDINFFV